MKRPEFERRRTLAGIAGEGRLVPDLLKARWPFGEKRLFRCSGPPLYDKACLVVLIGEPGPALESLRRSLEPESALRARAAEDPDLESLRGRLEFLAVVSLGPWNTPAHACPS